ncbi:MAG TPA: hypothetical protein VIX19_05445 [Terriglobales bacterium]
MSSLIMSVTIFACVLGGSLLGMFVRARMPREHLNAESRDVIKLAMGIIATMTAIVLGLLVASAKGYYDGQARELTEMSAKIVLLDRVLAHYGPEANDARNLLRRSMVVMLDKLWREDSPHSSSLEPAGRGEGIYDKIQELSPHTDAQRFLQSQALNLGLQTAQTRMLMFEQQSSSISLPLLMVVVFSLSITFASFSLHAPPNPMVIASLVLCALAVAATLFLIQEMYSPFRGLIQIPSDPLRNALSQLGR